MTKTARTRNKPSSQGSGKTKKATNAKREESKSNFSKATGTTDSELQNYLIKQVWDALWLPARLSDKEQLALRQSAFSLLQQIGPRNGIEGMLAVQIVATHCAAMECSRRAMLENQTGPGSDLYLKHASKLFGIFARQFEALNKSRNRGQQEVIVKHVHVEASGEATVGNIDRSASERSAGPKQEEPRSIDYKPAKLVEVDTNDTEHVPARKRRKDEGKEDAA